MSRSRYRVMGRLDGAGGARVGTVTIDRHTGIFEVRPLRRRRTFSMPLSTVADMVCRAIIFSEMHERRAAKKARRRR